VRSPDIRASCGQRSIQDFGTIAAHRAAATWSEFVLSYDTKSSELVIGLFLWKLLSAAVSWVEHDRDVKDAEPPN
jgi:hypothetical protein